MSAEVSENWRPVVGYEGWYEVSDLGRVRRAAPGKSTYVGRILKSPPSTDGYPHVTLVAFGRQTIDEVHRLVARAFLGPKPFAGAQVNHIDGDKTNARLTNLEYVNQSQNMRHSYALGLHVAQRGIPQKCSTCGSLGHKTTACLERLADVIDEMETLEGGAW